MVDRFHGGLSGSQRQQLPAAALPLLDFSVSLNAYGPSATLRDALRAVPLGEYPDPECLTARQALAAQFGVSPAQVALGNGASELLWSLAGVFGGSGKRLLVCEPCFSETRAAFSVRGTEIVPWRAQAPDFDFQVEEVIQLARRWAVDAVYLCAPSSPAGRHVPREALEKLARTTAPAVVILDQAFLSLSAHAHELHSALPQNVIAVRSLTKELGLPAIRVGYLIAGERIVEALETQRSRWTVSSHAQEAARLSCEGAEFLEDCRTRMLAQCAKLQNLFHEYGFDVVPSCTGYCLLRSPIPVAELRTLLIERHGIVVRDCSSFGLPEYIRVGVKNEEAHNRLALALKDLFPASDGHQPWSLKP